MALRKIYKAAKIPNECNKYHEIITKKKKGTKN